MTSVDSDKSDPNSIERKSLDPDPESMRRLGHEAVDRIVDYLDALGEMPVASRGSNEEFAQIVDEPTPLGPSALDDCMEFFFRQVVPGMTRVNHPRFHAYIPCPSSFPASIGAVLAAGTNPFVGSWLGGATVASLELTVLRWIKELLQLHPASEGVFTSGGSVANLVGIASARSKFGRGIVNNGVVYVSQQGHGSVEKAAAITGFDPDNIRYIETGRDCCIDVQMLEKQIACDRATGLVPFFVSANAGTTNTGAIDDLESIAEICRRDGLWFHVDAAYGGFAAMVPEIRQQMAGIERADSLTLDPHKWLYCPMGVGCAFVQNQTHLETAFSTSGQYLKDLPPDEVNFFDRGPELSRPARVLPVWMLLRSVGREALVDQIRTDIRLAHLASELLELDERFEVDPVGLSIVPFRHRARVGEDEVARACRDDALIEATLTDGELMLSSTTLDGVNTLRLVVMNHRTTESDIRRSVARIRELAK